MEQRVNENMTAKEYEKYVKKKTPVHSTGINMVRAFLIGGLICVIGQALSEIYQYFGIEKEAAGTWTSITLILLSILLTCLNLYPSLVKWGGAGALVPITGFANGMVSTAVEYQKEGMVFGLGCKLFIIAGPVILYGVLTSWVLGCIAWLFQW